MTATRYSHAHALLGKDTLEKVRAAKVLVVGAGGIGCELLKNLVLVGFGNIEVIDLDTIDLSNLNRQFLFRKADIKKSKAIVAAAFAHNFNPGPGPSGSQEQPGVRIKARHGNIKEEENDVEWLQGFDMVLSALDNLDARRHVNKLCCAAGVPLIESGTQGYLGQVTPMQKDRTECFDCLDKEAPKTFPVCTIRATPSEPIHCIVWAKSYLLSKLFGDDDEATDETELEKARADGENADEIDNLKREATAFREVRRNIGADDGPQKVFDKVFNADIQRLLSMDEMWKVQHRVKPIPLEYDAIMDGTFPLPHGEPSSKQGSQRVKRSGNAVAGPSKAVNGTNGLNGVNRDSTSRSNAITLKDQRELSIRDNLELFVDACKRLAARAITQPAVPITFDKDDDDTLDFVLATANLRAMAYGIGTKTRFQVKEMAGNIIPAIATTNAIVAGFIVMRAINLLRDDWPSCTNVFLRTDPVKPLGSFRPVPPNPACGICQDVYVPLLCDPQKLTLGTFVGEVVRKWLGWQDTEEGEPLEITVYEDKRVLADPDFDDNFGKTLEDLGVGRGKMLTVADEDERFANVCFALAGPLPETSSSTFALPANPPPVPARYKAPAPPAPPASSVGKRKRDVQEDETEVGPSAKKTKGEARTFTTVEDSDDELEIL